MAEIDAASAEQSQGIGQVNQAVMDMDGVTQQNAALFEEAAAAAQAMQEQAAKLSEVVGVKIDGSQVSRPIVTAEPSLKRKAVREVNSQRATTTKVTLPSSSGRGVKTGSAPAVTKPAAVSHEGTDDWEEF